MLEAGAAAPDFTLPDQDGEEVSLSGLKGETIVLYFYPRADTPGCTTQACSVRDRSAEYKAASARVIGKIRRDGALCVADVPGATDVPGITGAPCVTGALPSEVVST